MAWFDSITSPILPQVSFLASRPAFLKNDHIPYIIITSNSDTIEAIFNHFQLLNNGISHIYPVYLMA